MAEAGERTALGHSQGRAGQGKARQAGLGDELEASSTRRLHAAAAASSAPRRTAPACHAGNRLPHTHTTHPIALHCIAATPRTRYTSLYLSAHRTAADAAAAAHCPPPPSSELVPPPPPAAAPTLAIPSLPAFIHLMLRHNHSSSRNPPAAPSAAPLATGIGCGHAVCLAT